MYLQVRPGRCCGTKRTDRAALFAGLLILLGHLPAEAQQGCRFSLVDRVQGYSQTTRVDPENFIHYVSGGIPGGVDVRCADGVGIVADSAAIFDRDGRAELFGNVVFSDPETELHAGRAIYYANNRQLNAWEDVSLVDQQNGAVITGDELVLYRASVFRPMDRMVISGEFPHATIFLPDGGIEAAIPYEVDARRFILEGRRFFRAGGGVVVNRVTLNAVGDSLDFDQDLGVMSVFTDARVADSNFDLTAQTVTVLTPNGTTEEVLAREDAELDGDGVFLEAPAIRMFVRENLVQRLVALRTVPPIPTELTEWEDEAPEETPVDVSPEAEGSSPAEADSLAAESTGEVDALTEAGQAFAAGPDSILEAVTLPQPSATTAEFQLWADSIDIRSPDQALDRLIAVGRAKGESVTEDSEGPVAPEPTSDPEADAAADLAARTSPGDDGVGLASRDWMEGDTIVVAFKVTEPTIEVAADSTGDRALVSTERQTTVETITSSGSARSFYRLPPDSAEAGPSATPALHYVKASVIRIYLEEGQVTRMEVEGETSGFHFEPNQLSRPDTGSTQPPGSVQEPRPDPGFSSMAKTHQTALPNPLGDSQIHLRRKRFLWNQR